MLTFIHSSATTSTILVDITASAASANVNTAIPIIIVYFFSQDLVNGGPRYDE